MHSDIFRPSYEMRGDAPPPMDVHTYADRVMAEWRSLLDCDPTEPEVQAFLEAHPLLVPGAHLGLGAITPTGHAPFPQALITQPPLRGLTTRVPDFLWLAMDSLVFNPVFIEIEAPGKSWVTSQGRQHHQLTEALDQIVDWRDWLEKPANREIFLEGYQVPRLIRERKWQPIFVLIFGRKSENPRAVTRIRRSLLESNIITYPYEKLEPDPDSANYPCVRCGPNGYRATMMPPTVVLGPNSAENWSLIAEKERAIEASPWTTADRKAFLIERVPYWDSWGQGEHRGLRRLADSE